MKQNELELKVGIAGTLVGAVIGGVLALDLGAEAVNYAKTITENADVLTYMVNEHPTLTKFCSMGLGAHIGGSIGTIPSKLLGLIKYI